MAFTEKVHAFITAKYYVHLTEAFGPRGEAAFIHATRHYSEQRGRRMAQRAIRDGKPLTYATYCEYGEWVNTPEVIAEGCANCREIRAWAPDMEIHITVCPWHTQYKEMGLPQAGHIYCAHLDTSICRGFNPDISYKVPHSLHKSGYCAHIIGDANFQKGETHPKRPECLMPFQYHCGHAYYSYLEIATAIFGPEGQAVGEQVLADFSEIYGQEMAEILTSYENTNFNVI